MSTSASSNYGKVAFDVCGTHLPVTVMKSAAGFYLGTCNDDGPVSRESEEYWKSENQAHAAMLGGGWTQREPPLPQYSKPIDKYQKTRQLLKTLGNQPGGVIKADDVQAASQQLEQTTPDTSGTKAIIDKLRANEIHPALSDTVNKAAYEVAEPTSSRRKPRM